MGGVWGVGGVGSEDDTDAKGGGAAPSGRQGEAKGSNSSAAIGAVGVSQR
jgi:hypothetical protein